MKKSKKLMIASALLPPLTLFFFPLWNITLDAPQYPISLGMDIYITKITDANPYDLKNINLMNHYVGMKEIPSRLPEFDIFPIAVVLMAFVGLVIGFMGSYKWFLIWGIVMSVLGLIGLYDFYLWEYDYGHTLDPRAIIKFTNPDGTLMAYQPPLFGTKQILNFKVHSYPRAGAYLLLVSIILSFLAFLIGKKETIYSN